MGNKIEKFEKLNSWQEDVNMIINIYTLFKDSRNFGFRDQIQRTWLSIPYSTSTATFSPPTILPSHLSNPPTLLPSYQKSTHKKINHVV